MNLNTRLMNARCAVSLFPFELSLKYYENFKKGEVVKRIITRISLTIALFFSVSTFSQTSSDDHAFFFLTYSLSLKEDIKDYRWSDSDEQFSSSQQAEYEGSLGFKGQYFKGLSKWGRMAPLIGLGASISSRGEQKDDIGRPSEVGFWSTHLLLGGDMRDGFSSPIKNLLPYIGLGVGNKMRDSPDVERQGKMSDKIGVSYELGLLYNYERWLFGLSWQVIHGNYEFTASPESNWGSYKAKTTLKSALLNLGFAF